MRPVGTDGSAHNRQRFVSRQKTKPLTFIKYGDKKSSLSDIEERTMHNETITTEAPDDRTTASFPETIMPLVSAVGKTVSDNLDKERPLLDRIKFIGKVLVM